VEKVLFIFLQLFFYAFARGRTSKDVGSQSRKAREGRRKAMTRNISVNPRSSPISFTKKKIGKKEIGGKKVPFCGKASDMKQEKLWFLLQSQCGGLAKIYPGYRQAGLALTLMTRCGGRGRLGRGDSGCRRGFLNWQKKTDQDMEGRELERRSHDN